ncbi:recombinase family protein [Streptomyces olivoreticuli]|uniref:recombinase family protein n=1 Tax=Streptomyces olivoreticuli TaxID=68246 RepID=UPI00265A9BBE|nr:recombinase family protein [Streptomyces olivoreticuli]WKK26218.1 recombinase family protein [Streptomyces olivoreticuli]
MKTTTTTAPVPSALVSDAGQSTHKTPGVKTFAPARTLAPLRGDTPPVVIRRSARPNRDVTDTAARAELAFSLRLSRSSDESSSLDVQLRACRLKAEALGFDAETIAAAEANAYVDDGVSGGSALEGRKKGMARIMAARPAVVIAWKLDRFARSVREFQKLMDWADENGVRLVTSDSLLDSADKSGTGRLIATIIASSPNGSWASSRTAAKRPTKSAGHKAAGYPARPRSRT